MKKLLLASLCAISGMLYSQSTPNAFLDWTTTGGTQNSFYKNIVKIDAAKNVYVAGATVAANGLNDIFLAKYNAHGVLLWEKHVDGLAHATDFATNIFIDGSGNVYLTGTITNDSVNFYSDIVCIKYNSSGTQQFLVTWDGGTAHDAGADIRATPTGSFVITGSTTNASYNTDMVTQLYSSTGTLVWSQTYDYTGMNDAGMRITTPGGNIAIAGIVQTGSTTYRGSVLSYNTAGTQLSFTTTTATSTGIDQVTCMETDQNGYIYIGGAKQVTGHGYDGWLMKLNSSLGVVFDRTYDGGANLDDAIQGVDFDNSGTAYATGYIGTALHGTDFLTMKCNTTTGDTSWTKKYDSPGHGNDAGADIQLDTNLNIYVTGYAAAGANGLDYYTAKLQNSNGASTWSVTLDGQGLDDKPAALALDTNNNVIVTGSSLTAPSTYQYLTAKYIQKDFITPVDKNGEAPNISNLYYENKGQILNQAGGIATDVLFSEMDHYPFTFYKANSFHFKLFNFDTLSAVSDTLQRIDVALIGANTKVSAVGTEQASGDLSIFDTQLPANVTDIRSFQRYVITDVYSNIDVQYYSNGYGQKIYYVVKPGGNPNNIKWRIDGANSTTITANQLKIQGINNLISYAAPIVYQEDGTGSVLTLTGTAAWQSMGANTYSLTVPSYTTSLPLIIEINHGNFSPVSSTGLENFEMTTFYGGALDEGIRTLKVNNKTGSYATVGTTMSWAAGHTFPTINNYITSGVCSSCGQYYMTAVIFDTTGRRLCTNIYGTGNNIDPQEAFLDDHYNLTIIGNTSSTTLPTPYAPGLNPGTYSNSHGAGFVVQFARVNASIRTIKWQTRLNGYASDIVQHPVTKDIYITTSTDQMYLDLMLKANAFNCAGAPGNWNYQISKFDSIGVRKWATLFPSPNTTASTANGSFLTGFAGASGDYYNKCRIACDKYGFTLAGEVNSSGLQIFNKYHKSIDSTYNGGADAFVARFNSQDSLVFSGYVGGSGDDGYYDVKLTKNNEIAMVGYSKSLEYKNLTYHTNPTQYIDTTYSTTHSKLLISKIDTTGSKIWSTLYGTGTDDCAAWTVENDQQGNLYISGTTSPTGFNASYTNAGGVCGYPANRGGISDLFILAFNPYNAVFWDVYIGGSLSDYCSTLAYNPISNKMMLAGSTSSSAAPYGTYPTYFPASWYGIYDATRWFNGQINSSDGLATYTYFGPSDGFIGWFNMVGITTGVEEYQQHNFLNNTLSVFPNPTNGSSDLLIKNALTGRTLIEIYNSVGQLLYSESRNHITDNMIISLPTQNFDSGIYFISVKNSDLSQSCRIIVNK